MSDMPTPKGYVVYTYSHPVLKRTLSVLSHLAVAVTVLCFAVSLVIIATKNPWHALGIALVCLIPYAVLSLFRRWFDAPRPYELFDFSGLTDTPPHKKRGRSFPSRHVFSSFVIGTVLSFIIPPVGLTLCVLGAALAASRVLLGIHFLRDVVAGALVGIISGIIGTLIVNFGLLPLVP